MEGLFALFLSSKGLKGYSFNPDLDLHELMFVHTNLTEQHILEWLEKSNPGFLSVLFHLIWKKLELIFRNQGLYLILLIPIVTAALSVRFKNKPPVGEVFMKNIIDTLIFDHEIKMGRLSSMMSLKKHLAKNKGLIDNPENERKMTIWEKLKAPERPVNLIKLLNVIQESRQMDIQAKMEEREDPFMAKPKKKVEEPAQEYYTFVNDLLRLESNSSVKKR